MTDRAKVLFSLVFLAFFVFVWGSICIDMIRFTPTTEKPSLEYGDVYVTVAGGLATTLSAGVGALLGVKSGAGGAGVADVA